MRSFPARRQDAVGAEGSQRRAFGGCHTDAGIQPLPVGLPCPALPCHGCFSRQRCQTRVRSLPIPGQPARRVGPCSVPGWARCLAGFGCGCGMLCLYRTEHRGARVRAIAAALWQPGEPRRLRRPAACSWARELGTARRCGPWAAGAVGSRGRGAQAGQEVPPSMEHCHTYRPWHGRSLFCSAKGL